MRLTADGRFHLCLLKRRRAGREEGPSLGGRAREVAPSSPARSASSPPGHRLEEGISTEERSMFQLGG